MIAVATVHTSGINWESLITIVSSVTVLVSIIIGGFLRQQSRAISSAINNMSVMLESKLETKERVAKLAQEITILKARLENRR